MLAKRAGGDVMNNHDDRMTTGTATLFPSFISLRVAHSELLQRDPESGDHKEYITSVKDFIEQAQATGALLSDDEERRTSQSMLNYWVTVLYRANDKPPNATLAEYKPDLTLDITDASCPYPGVRAFREEDSKYFFGRQRQIDYMFNRLKEDRLLVVAGPSGSGKTSLVQAGLLPALKKDEPNSGKRHFFPAMVPGRNPLANLARMVKREGDVAADWAKQRIGNFQQGHGHLLKIIAEVDAPAVIVVDQFDEVFWLCKDKSARQSFINNLLSVIQSPSDSSSNRHIVILTMRNDDYDDDVKHLPPEFVELFARAKVLLPALNANELRDAIEKPAELVCLKFGEPIVEELAQSTAAAKPKSSESIVQALIKEIVSEPAGLPLLQFTLTKLYQKREGNVIPYQAFHEMRSCRAVLAASAEDFFKNLPGLDPWLTEGRVLREMIKLDAEMRIYTYPVVRGDLYRVSEKNARVDGVLQKLTEEQLVRVTNGVTPSDDLFELTHDSLLSSWGRMEAWVRAKKSWRLWRRRLARAVAAVLLIALGLLAAILYGRKQDYDLSLKLAEQSNKQLDNNRFDLALLLGSEAYEVDDNPATRSNLLRLLKALQFSPQPKTFLYEKDYEVADLAFSPDGKRLAAIDDSGSIIVWDLTQPKATKKTLPSSGRAFYPLTFSEDGNTLASASLDEETNVILWDVATGKRINTLSIEKNYQVVNLVFRPKTETLAVVGGDGRVTWWDLTSGKHQQLPTQRVGVTDLAFNSDGKWLALGGSDGTVILRNLAQRAPDRIFSEQGK